MRTEPNTEISLLAEHWEVLENREVYAAAPWIRVMLQKVLLPNGRVVGDYHRIELADCVIVFAETCNGQVVVERQYKHGPGKIDLSLPAGAIEAGEAPLVAAQRELLEETGYEAPEWHALGGFTAHGNYGCGSVHLFLARGAARTSDPVSDDLEQTTVLVVSKDDLLRSIAAGDIDLLGSATAILLALEKLRECL